MLYVANYSDDGVYSMAVNPASDLLSNSTSPVTVGDAPDGIAALPDRGPTAAFTAGGGSVAGGATGFDASESVSLDAPLAAYLWDFGDGQTTGTTNPVLQHTYAAPGVYTATLQVVDKNSCSEALVFTGQTASCAANPAAVVTHQVTVSSKGVPPPIAGATISKLKAKFKKKQLTVSLTLSSASPVKFAFAKKKGKKFKSAGSVTKPGKAGANTFKIKKKLKKGSYRLTATPTGGKAVTANFKVK